MIFDADILKSETSTVEEKLKLAFAEGYMAGQAQGKSGGRRWLKVAQQLLTIVLVISIFISLMGMFVFFLSFHTFLYLLIQFDIIIVIFIIIDFR